MPWIPFVKTGYLGTNQWVPLVNGNGLTAGGGEPVPEIVWVKVSGTSPLSLPGAIANSIKSLTQYGLCTQSTTPTPSAPVDIVCNNGTLKWNSVNQRVYADGTPEVLTVSATGAETQTVTDIPMLLSVNDYKDEQDIISGAVTRKVGIKVLDGTEGWVTTSVTSVSRALNIISDASTSNSAICASTHFVGATHGTSSANMPDNGIRAGYGTAAQKGDLYIKSASYPTGETLSAWLASQYAAGTPVIVIYPLAEETTEQGTAHDLHTSEGDNVVDVTANVSPISLECEYANGYEQ